MCPAEEIQLGRGDVNVDIEVSQLVSPELCTRHLLANLICATHRIPIQAAAHQHLVEELRANLVPSETPPARCEESCPRREFESVACQEAALDPSCPSERRATLLRAPFYANRCSVNLSVRWYEFCFCKSGAWEIIHAKLPFSHSGYDFQKLLQIGVLTGKENCCTGALLNNCSIFQQFQNSGRHLDFALLCG